jgi:uncharacterized membrane-anchored protein
MSLLNHPLRERVVSEMHMRRMPVLSPPMVMTQIVRLVEPEERSAERDHILNMPGVPSDAFDIRNRHIGGRSSDGIDYMWEGHSEASTATIIAAAKGIDPFAPIAENDAELAWLVQAPGRVLRAVRIAIVANEADAAKMMTTAGFSAVDLVSCRVGSTQIWSDFLIRSDQFGRLLVMAGDHTPADLGRIVTQLQELGNYRNLSLMGLPLAQAEGQRVADLEQNLVIIAERMAKGEADPSLLDQLCVLAAQVTAITATTAFRMSATAAYAQIVQDRLQSLNVTNVAGYQTLEEFTERRLLPATRTCASFSARLEALSVRIERATSLLRTRVEMQLQSQNASLLQSMDKNAERQLRLQRIVEGLSVVAVGYYAVSLLSSFLQVGASRIGMSHEVLTAICIPPVVTAVWFYLRQRVRKIVGHGPNIEGAI